MKYWTPKTKKLRFERDNAEGDRIKLHEAVQGSLTSFVSSWWLLFVFSVPVSLYFLSDFDELIKPLILTYIESEETQGNLHVLSIVLYLCTTITLPFFVVYGVSKLFLTNHDIAD